MQRSGSLPKLPKNVVRPEIVAGVNALGRGQDRESLTMFITTVAQTLGPEALMKYIDPSEAIKRLATAQGIETLRLVRTDQQIQQMSAQAQQQAQQQELLKQAGQFASSPMMDPTKNPNLNDQQQSPNQEIPPQADTTGG